MFVLREIGCRCLLNESKRVVHKPGQLVSSNKFDSLSVVDPVESNSEYRSDNEHIHVDINIE